MNKNTLTRSTLVATSVTIIFTTVLTVAGELYKVTGADGKTLNPIKDLLKALHGHHWVGKGIWAVAIFIAVASILYFLGRNRRDEQPYDRLVTFLSYTLCICTIILFSFFTFEYVIH